MNNIQTEVYGLNPDELKRQWSDAWGLRVPAKMGQKMLKKSLVHKLKERAG